MSNKQTIEFDEVQSYVFTGFGTLKYSRYLFLEFLWDDDAAHGRTHFQETAPTADRVRNWLKHIVGQISTGRSTPDERRTTEWAYQLAFTGAGLEKLGFAEAEMVTFPPPFHQGMASTYRNRILGDEGVNAPENWEIGGPRGNPIHAALLVFTKTEALRNSQQSEIQALIDAQAPGKVLIRYTEDGFAPDNSKEQFGFHDGIAQPAIAGTGKKQSDGQPPSKTGEFILGYEDEYNELPTSPSVPSGLDPHGYLYLDPIDSGRRDLGRNGTYLVYRKLEQDVAGFWKFALDNSGQDKEKAIKLASGMIGRWPSGAPMVLSPDYDDGVVTNDFNYREEDPMGHKCPIGSHLRRNNPRDSKHPDAKQSLLATRYHRIIRRGRSYGDQRLGNDTYSPTDDGEKRGLQFIAVNADIRRQFEFIMQTWVNSAKTLDLYEDPDPLLGVPEIIEGQPKHTMTIQKPGLDRKLAIPKLFVTVKGGAYLFLPSRRGLHYIASGGYAKPGRAATK